ncbi:MAG: (d)CMP kinase [Phycisphaerae bacterium]|jgi:cytidylate kinase
MIITIDGCAASGKSTVARELASHLGIAYLDTGAMYRAVAFAALNRGVNFKDPSALLDLARNIELEVHGGAVETKVFVDGTDATKAIRTMQVSEHTAAIAQNPDIRTVLVERQRRIGRQLKTFVTEGRDQGSVVFPDADAKVILEATLEKRVERRLREFLDRGVDVDQRVVERDLRLRDQADARHWAPLLVPGNAFVVDTTDLTIAEVVARIASLVASLSGRPGGASGHVERA